jgi:uncharacterized protein (DUF58 family)
MTNTTLEVNRRNGLNGHGQFTAEFKFLLDDLAVAQKLRQDALRQIGAMRRAVYARAREQGISVRVLKAAHAIRNHP